jgi:hypothetical protein
VFNFSELCEKEETLGYRKEEIRYSKKTKKTLQVMAKRELTKTAMHAP